MAAAEKPPEEPGSGPEPAFFRREERAERGRAGAVPGLAVGQVVGDFRLVALLGQGGMGQVWEAQQVSLARAVAVKFVRPEQVTDRHLEYFAREARAGGRLNHPGIVTVYGCGRTAGQAWISMELVGGAWTLRSFLEEIARADEVPAGYDRRVATLVAEIAEAMQAAHEAGVIHRDLKPQNVLITADDRPKVTDFGLARITDEAALSQSGDFAGTYFYMSPEQVAAKRHGIDHRTDIFSLGIVLYELLALRRPFQGDSWQQVAAQISSVDPPDLRAIRSRVPRDLAVIAAKALEKDRDQRFQSMAELAADLRRHLADEPIHAQPPTPLERAVKWTRRNPGKSSAAAIAAVTFTIIAWLLWANLRANRSLTAERASLARTNQALEVKTSESEARRVAAEQAAERERIAAAAATERADEVLRLSALQSLEELTAEAERLWPAHPDNLARYDDWLRQAAALVAELPAHRAKLAELRERALPLPEAERARQRANHPRLAELQHAERRLAFLRGLAAAAAGDERREPTALEVGIDLAALPAIPGEVNALAWPLVDPDREEFGGERRGLVLARRALELARDAAPAGRAAIRDTLAWALYANGRFDEALAEEERALAESADATRQQFADYVLRLREAIESETDPEREAERARRLVELEEAVAALEAEVSRPTEWSFADNLDEWWHNQLEKLVAELEALGADRTGVFSEGISPEHGWGVPKRRAFAETIAERSLTGADAASRWSEAQASIADPGDCPEYGGLTLAPQLGLLPLGRDPRSGLWEFAELQTGAPAVRAADGELTLEEDTGLVLVLLPGGNFRMGAQSSDPAGANYDLQAEQDEIPPHAVRLEPFFLSKYEMTQGQWMRLTGSNPSRDHPEAYDPRWNRAGQPGSLLHPVEQVSWIDCTRVLSRAGLELPLEAQWEYAARGGTDSVWWCGDDRQAIVAAGNLRDLYAKEHGGSSWGPTEPWDDGNTPHGRVGGYAANGFGLHDVIGNVWEWCQDSYGGRYTRCIRGASFNELSVDARSSNRNDAVESVANIYLGLRPARRVTP